jgi:hypothetical protein
MSGCRCSLHLRSDLRLPDVVRMILRALLLGCAVVAGLSAPVRATEIPPWEEALHQHDDDPAYWKNHPVELLYVLLLPLGFANQCITDGKAPLDHEDLYDTYIARLQEMWTPQVGPEMVLQAGVAVRNYLDSNRSLLYHCSEWEPPFWNDSWNSRGDWGIRR